MIHSSRGDYPFHLISPFLLCVMQFIAVAVYVENAIMEMKWQALCVLLHREGTVELLWIKVTDLLEE